MPRLSWARWGAFFCIIALILLGLAWELWLAPLRPGGSWLALKVLPLLLPLRGLMQGRPYPYRWTGLLIWLYVLEAVVRLASDPSPAYVLATASLVLSLGFFFFAALYLRLSVKLRSE